MKAEVDIEEIIRRLEDNPALKGAQGKKGAKGDHGDTGQTGPRGMRGPAGIQGPQGPKGEPGDVDYDRIVQQVLASMPEQQAAEIDYDRIVSAVVAQLPMQQIAEQAAQLVPPPDIDEEAIAKAFLRQLPDIEVSINGQPPVSQSLSNAAASGKPARFNFSIQNSFGVRGDKAKTK